MFPFFEIFGRQIPLYGLSLVVGTVIGILLLSLMARKKGLLRDDAFYSALYALIGGLIGAKLLYLLTVLPILVSHFDYFSGSFSALYALFAGGYVYYGGLLGGVFAMWLYSRQFKTPFLPYLDHAAVFLPLVHAFGRVGCFFAGCCYGIPYQGRFAVCFPPETLGLAGVALFPVQLLESLLNFLLFLGLFFAFRKQHQPGQATGTYLVCYALLRFGLEFLRYDEVRGSFWLLSTSQWISVIAFFGGLLLLYFSRRRGTLSKQKNVI
ncbi:MAG TPA: prolipoprotein diacylglyceryl transferase [Clostridiales bacterium]|nr:prolipoprotein diacylglyceryl transferase [Clostridiales bacterium]